MKKKKDFQRNYSKKKKQLSSIAYTTWKRHFHFLSEERATLQERLQRELKGQIGIVSHNKNEDR